MSTETTDNLPESMSLDDFSRDADTRRPGICKPPLRPCTPGL